MRRGDGEWDGFSEMITHGASIKKKEKKWVGGHLANQCACLPTLHSIWICRL